MCLYPKLIHNPRYYKGGKRIYDVLKKRYKDEECTDTRQLWVAVGCGNCLECRKQKAREWQIRLNEELKTQKHAYFITLTFEPNELKKLCEEKGTTETNAIATIAVRRFLERWRKKYKKSLRHWLITELGHEGTERIHLHGILFSDNELNNDQIHDIWKYGITYTGDYCNSKTINYIIKYVTKIDIDHKGYKAIILSSSGLGACYYKNKYNIEKHAFKGKETRQYYTLPDGTQINLPIYYRNHFWTEKQRQDLWTNMLDTNRRYILGIPYYDIDNEGYNLYARALEEQQKLNTQMGYGSSDKEWSKKNYYITREMMNKGTNK